MPSRSFIVTMCTSLGKAKATIMPVLCGSCENVVGLHSAEYNCVDSCGDVWFDKSFIEMDYRYYVSSGFSLSRLASTKVLWKTNEDFGCTDDKRSVGDAYSRAFWFVFILIFLNLI